MLARLTVHIGVFIRTNRGSPQCANGPFYRVCSPSRQKICIRFVSYFLSVGPTPMPSPRLFFGFRSTTGGNTVLDCDNLPNNLTWPSGVDLTTPGYAVDTPGSGTQGGTILNTGSWTVTSQSRFSAFIRFEFNQPSFVVSGNYVFIAKCLALLS